MKIRLAHQERFPDGKSVIDEHFSFRYADWYIHDWCKDNVLLIYFDHSDDLYVCRVKEIGASEGELQSLILQYLNLRTEQYQFDDFAHPMSSPRRIVAWEKIANMDEREWHGFLAARRHKPLWDSIHNRLLQ